VTVVVACLPQCKYHWQKNQLHQPANAHQDLGKLLRTEKEPAGGKVDPRLASSIKFLFPFFNSPKFIMNGSLFFALQQSVALLVTIKDGIILPKPNT
jgi:hypothetical protein